MELSPKEVQRACELLAPEYDGVGRPSTGRQELADYVDVHPTTVSSWADPDNPRSCSGPAAKLVRQVLERGADQ